jgi:hypothetical protein
MIMHSEGVVTITEGDSRESRDRSGRNNRFEIRVKVAEG